MNCNRAYRLQCIYFLLLMTQALRERELRLAMEGTDADSVSLYPKKRNCRRPTARMLVGLFHAL